MKCSLHYAFVNETILIKTTQKADLSSLTDLEEVMKMLLWWFNESLMVSWGCSLVRCRWIRSFLLLRYEAVTPIRWKMVLRIIYLFKFYLSAMQAADNSSIYSKADTHTATLPVLAVSSPLCMFYTETYFAFKSFLHISFPFPKSFSLHFLDFMAALWVCVCSHAVEPRR